jgi:hypothetical protein
MFFSENTRLQIIKLDKTACTISKYLCAYVL